MKIETTKASSTARFLGPRAISLLCYITEIRGYMRTCAPVVKPEVSGA